jgi:hypothetical protein
MLRKLLLIFSFTLLGMVTVQAQYTASASNSPYAALSGGVDVTGGAAWDDSLWTVPIGFNFTVDGVTGNSLMLTSNGYAVMLGATAQKFLVSYFADLVSRPGGSPITYQTTGAAGSRILKIQWSNAGFFDGTATDFTNFQMWLYEGSNIFETRMGTSAIGFPIDVFDAPGPAVGVIASLDQNDNITGQFLTGSVTSPTLLNQQGVSTPASLNGIPASGQVYTLTPTGLAAPDDMELLVLASWPNPTTDVVNLNGLTVAGVARLYNALGQLVSTQTVEPGTSSVRLHNLSSGLYQLEVISRNARFTEQIIKQ